jgi:hypothetical protein
MKRPVMISMCDKSGIMARPWAEAGYTCLCIDIQHSIRATRKKKHIIDRFEGGGEIHYLYGDGRSWKPSDFDKSFHSSYHICFVACFPVCTNLAGSGSQDWGHGKYEPPKGIPMLMDGMILFNSCEQIADWSGAPYCVENPKGCIPTHHRKPDYYFHPWHYGELYQKYTCLWTGNGFVMPEKKFITKPEGVTQKIWLAYPGLNRQDERSETPEAFARAVFEANKKQLYV